MIAPRVRGAMVLVLATLAAACGGSSSEPLGNAATPAAITIVSGNGQVGLSGQTLALPLVVRVTNSSGSRIGGIAVSFAVSSGAATVNPTTATTDTAGLAKTNVTLGATPGNIAITATVNGTSLATTFVATIGTSNLTLACDAGAPTTPAVGTVLPGVTGTGVCLGGGSSGAEYALVAFHGNPDSSAIQALTVTGKGATAVSTAAVAAMTDLAATSAFSPMRAAPGDLRSAFDARLRATARRELTPMMSTARARFRLSARFNAIPANPAIGSLVTLNANALQACSQINRRTARVAAVSDNAIVVADTANPAGGFTDAEYLSFARMFDTLISPLDVRTFGTPSDIDKNGKIVIFFTKEVNALTPANSTEGTIGGFFFERDLFPLSDTQDLVGCAGSNFAEMFYLLVPDPNGVYGRSHTKQDVLEITPSTIAHEYQHLINASRRLYVNDANAFEDQWLNEGLSHIAEELLYYEISGFAPRQNLGVNAFTTQAAVDAFNLYQLDNNARFEFFIAKPNQTSAFGGEDKLETRGATWNLLRYLADHRGSADGDVWSQLVNTTLTGQANLARVFGANYMTQIRDWATSVFADDVPGVTDARFLAPSWNLRSIFPNLIDSRGQRLGKYPLTVVPLSESTPASVSVAAGGAAYLRFGVPANGQASIDWSSGGLPASPLMQFTVVRTK